MTGLRLLALVEGGAAEAVRAALPGADLRLVPLGPLLVVAGAAARRPALSADALRRHDRVVRRLADPVDAVLPVRFGTWVPAEQDLRRLLEPRLDGLRQALDRVRGREQMMLRLFGEPAADEAQVAASVDSGASFLHARARRRRLADVGDVQGLRAALARFVADERVERHAGRPLLATLYHLVPRGSSAAYLGAVRRALAGGSPLRAAASGPWPPYAFAEDPA